QDSDPNERSGCGGTALAFAAENGHETIVRILLQHAGVDVNARGDCRSGTPLYRAVRNSHATIVKLLLEQEDIDVN
ncbi:ankyrin repeat-containing domain protein, partial [Kalaharituber pfeilii]